MSSPNLEVQNLTTELDYLLHDIDLVKDNVNSIEITVFDTTIANQLTSKYMKYYIDVLIQSPTTIKPETHIRETFFAGINGIIPKLVFMNISFPEARIGNGFIDFFWKTQNNKPILLELKPWIKKDKRTTSSGEVFILKEIDLKWENHKDQVYGYLKENYRFLILTNLKTWYIFSDKNSSNIDEIEPIATLTSSEFLRAVEQITDLNEFLERKEAEKHSKDIKKSLYKKLKIWLDLFSSLKWNISQDKDISEIIIGIVNKLLVLQIFDDLALIPFRYLQNTWRFYDERWSRKGEKIVVKDFFDEIVKWFYEFYDTDFFTINEIDFLVDEPDNWKEIYVVIKKILGILDAYYYISIPSVPFSNIDEDVMGHAYETLLGELRKEQGIYYTPKFVTEHISEKICDYLFKPLIYELEKAISPDLTIVDIEEILNKFIRIKIIDPSCGSGSFLVKIFYEIIKYYDKAIKLIDRKIQDEETEIEGRIGNRTDMRYWQEHGQKVKPFIDIKKKFLGVSHNKIPTYSKLYANILIRHIYGVDLDFRAIDIAKLNLWIAIIRKIPKEFRYDKLPLERDKILPSLSLNLRQGNSILQLSQTKLDNIQMDNEFLEFVQDLTQLREKTLQEPFLHSDIQIMNEKIEQYRNRLFQDKLDYLSHPEFDISIETEDQQIIFQILQIYNKRDNLTVHFQGDELIEKQSIVNQCSTFLWHLDFYGIRFDAVVGNPPYVDIKRLPQLISNYLFRFFNFSFNRVNLFCAFSELAITKDLLNDKGFFGYIVPNPICIKSSYKKFRLFWEKHHWIIQVIRVPNNTFNNEILDKEVDVEPVILISQGKDLEEEISIDDLDILETEILVFLNDTGDYQDTLKLIPADAEIHTIKNQKTWINREHHIINWWFSVSDEKLLNKVDIDTEELQVICDRSSGITPYDKKKGHTPKQISQKVFHFTESNKNQSNNPQRLITGESIIRYNLKWPTAELCYLDYGDWLAAPREWRFFSEPRLLIRQIRTGMHFLRIFATYVKSDFVNTTIGFNLVLKEAKVEDYYLEYILAILNSYLMSLYYHLKFMDPGKQSHSKVLIEKAKTLPIKKLPLTDQELFRTKVWQLLFLNNYIKCWLHIFDQKHQLLGMSKKKNLKSIRLEAINLINATPSLRNFAWFQNFVLNPPYDDLEFELPNSYNLYIDIITQKSAIVYIYNPNIQTKKLFEFTTVSEEVFELTILGLYKFISKKRSNFPTSVDNLFSKIELPIRGGLAPNHRIDSANLTTNVVLDYQNFLKTQESLNYCELLEHTNYCNHTNVYQNRTDVNVQLIQGKLKLSELLQLKRSIDAEIEAHILQLYDIDFNSIFDKVEISIVEKDIILSKYSNQTEL